MNMNQPEYGKCGKILENCFQKHDILVGGLEHEFYDFPSIGTHMFRG
jgi:hypothetical protein